jgi:hypothetical protein
VLGKVSQQVRYRLAMRSLVAPEEPDRVFFDPVPQLLSVPRADRAHVKSPSGGGFYASSYYPLEG